MLIQKFFKNIRKWVMRKRDDFPGSILPTDDEKPNRASSYDTECFWEDAVM